MVGKEEIARVCEEVKALIHPEKIYLFGSKVNASGEKLKGFDLCVIADVEDKLDTERLIYSKIEASMPFNVVVYTKNEWEELLEVEDSFAHFINKKGTIIYEKR